MPYAELVKLLGQLPPKTAVAVIILLVFGAVILLALLVALYAVKFFISQQESRKAHQERATIAQAAGCNIPSNVVDDLRDAIDLQQVDVAESRAAQRQAVEVMSQLKASVNSLDSTLNRLADRIMDFFARKL